MKVKTGIPGLDELLIGGLPEKSVVLVSGGPGSGKSILCAQFLYNGALHDEPGVYISMEEGPDQIINNMKKFGWNLADPKIQVEKLSLYNFDAMKDTIRGLVEKGKAKRLVIDPITHLGLFFDRRIEIRKSLVELSELIKRLEISALFSAEIPKGTRGISTWNMEEFVADGVIVLHDLVKEGSTQKTLQVLKMRGSDHDKELHPFEISSRGIKVFHKDRVF